MVKERFWDKVKPKKAYTEDQLMCIAEYYNIYIPKYSKWGEILNILLNQNAFKMLRDEGIDA